MQDIIKYLGTDAARASINVAGRTATVNGSGVDLAGYEGATAVAVMGAWAGNQGTWAITMEESSDNSSFTTPGSTDLLGTAPTLSGYVNRAIVGQRYVGDKRYVRAVATLTGGGVSCTFGVIIVKGLKRHVAP